MSNYIQGRFVPRNPSKYIGDLTNIFARSSWEFKAMNFFDSHPSILKWNSEEIQIPYFSPVDNRVRRYFPDFLVEHKTVTGEIKKSLVEIKPLYQTIPPKLKGKQNKRFITEQMTYITNEAKWKAAKAWCQEKGIGFMILTEKQLYGY